MATREERIQELKEAFANIDKEEAARISASLPVFDISDARPGQVVAIHYTRHSPRPAEPPGETPSDQ